MDISAVKPFIIGFNGPPHVGKDTIADALRIKIGQIYHIGTHRAALSMPMREVVYALIGETYTKSHYEANKDAHHPLLGTSIRQAMIKLSEQHIKPTYGRDYWARFLLHQNRGWWNHVPAVMIISDIGFVEEVKYLEDKSTMLTVQLSRDGTDWSKDSRSYVCGEYNFDTQNNGSIDECVNEILLHIVRLGWKL